MELTLFYRGQLKSNGDATHKHEIRKQFAPQIFRRFPAPVVPNQFVTRELGDLELHFRSPITKATRMTADLNITFLRPSAPGNIIQHGGDIDNRLKTLFDALRCPNVDEVPEKERQEIIDVGRSPVTRFRCLLEDDALISSLSVRTDRLLDVDPTVNPNEVVLVIHVTGVLHDQIHWIPE